MSNRAAMRMTRAVMAVPFVGPASGRRIIHNTTDRPAAEPPSGRGPNHARGPSHQRLEIGDALVQIRFPPGQPVDRPSFAGDTESAVAPLDQRDRLAARAGPVKNHPT